MFYGRSWQGVSFDEFMDQVNSYINWKNETHIKISLGGVSPVEYRKRLGVTA
jgi:transposase InsO family protein